MINAKISNINNINIAYSSIDNRLTKSVSKMKSDYEVFVDENVYYRKTNIGKIIISIIMDVLFVFLLIKHAVVEEVIRSFIGLEEQMNNGEVLNSMIFWILLIGLLYCIYKSCVLLYCKKIEGYSRRIKEVERKVNEAIMNMKSSCICSDVVAAAMNNEEYTMNTSNEIGAEMVSIRVGFTNTNKKAYNVKKFIDIGTSTLLYLFLIFFLFIKINGKITINPISGITMVLLYLTTVTVINVIQFNVGEYIGKISKAIGSFLAVFYGLVLMIGIKNAYAIPAFVSEETVVSSGINMIYLVVPLVQFVGIVLCVCCSHYGLEKEKWEQGFEVPMTYGSKDNGNKVNLLFRGGLAVLLALIMCSVLSMYSMANIGSVVLVATLWYCSNTVLKPRGSYLYTFWGCGKAISNEIVMFAMVITAAACGRGSISFEEIAYFAVAFVGSFIIAIGAHVANNMIY